MKSQFHLCPHQSPRGGVGGCKAGYRSFQQTLMSHWELTCVFQPFLYFYPLTACITKLQTTVSFCIPAFLREKEKTHSHTWFPLDPYTASKRYWTLIATPLGTPLCCASFSSTFPFLSPLPWFVALDFSHPRLNTATIHAWGFVCGPGPGTSLHPKDDWLCPCVRFWYRISCINIPKK